MLTRPGIFLLLPYFRPDGAVRRQRGLIQGRALPEKPPPLGGGVVTINYLLPTIKQS